MPQEVGDLMAVRWQRLAEHTNWLALWVLRESFLSKVTTTFAFVTFALANFAEVLQTYGFELWRVRVLFIGAILFLSGYLVVGLRIPKELRSVVGLDEMVSRMVKISDLDYLNTRRTMAIALARRMEVDPPADLPDGPLQYVVTRTEETRSLSEWNEQEARTLFHADLALRQYDRVKSRITAFGLLGLGLILLLIPTIYSVWQAISGQFYNVG